MNLIYGLKFNCGASGFTTNFYGNLLFFGLPLICVVVVALYPYHPFTWTFLQTWVLCLYMNT